MASLSSIISGLRLLPLPFIVAIGVPLAILARWAVLYTRTRLKIRATGRPAIHSLIEIFESLGRAFYPDVPLVLPVKKFAFDKPFQKYSEARTDMMCISHASTPSRLEFITSNVVAARLIAGRTDVFLKPLEDHIRYAFFNIFGHTLGTVQNGAEHKKHRDVLRPCFDEHLMEKGWDGMASLWQRMVDEEDLTMARPGDVAVLHGVSAVLYKLTLGAIGVSWFGLDMEWSPKKRNDWGAVMPAAEAMRTFLESAIAQYWLPQWFMEYNPIPYLRRLGKAHRSLDAHFKTAQVEAERKLAGGELQTADVESQPAKKTKYKDIIGALVGAGLSEKEIRGNTFVMLVAGHETTSHTTTFALALLAANPEWQEKMHAEVRELVLPAGSPAGTEPRPLSYKDMNRLPLTLAVLYETLRLRNEGIQLPRTVVKDFTLPYTTWEEVDVAEKDADGKITSKTTKQTVVREHTINIPAGSRIHMDVLAVGHNPFVWRDPHVFDPARHLRPSQTEPGKMAATFSKDHMGFSQGPRVCIGKRFAEVEMVCFLAHTALNYRWEVVPLPGETQAQANERASFGHPMFTLTPNKFDLRMTKR